MKPKLMLTIGGVWFLIEGITGFFMAGFLTTFGVSLVAYYAQWSGVFIDSPIGYIPPTLWLIVAIGFFLVGRANTSSTSN